MVGKYHFENVLLAEELLALAVRVFDGDLERIAAVVLDETHEEEYVAEQLRDEPLAQGYTNKYNLKCQLSTRVLCMYSTARKMKRVLVRVKSTSMYKSAQ